MSCPKCEELQGLLEDSEAAKVQLGMELAGRERQLRAAGLTEMRLLKRLEEEAEDDSPEAKQITALLVLWKDVVRNNHPRTNIKGAGPRRDRVKWAVKKYGAERIEQAIRGITLSAYHMENKYTDIARHVLKDEANIEKFSDLYLASLHGEAAVTAKPLPDLSSTLAPVPAEEDVEHWMVALQRDDRLLALLKEKKGWLPHTLEDLGVGWDVKSKRLTFPIRDAHGSIINLSAYASKATPKNVALPGCPRELWPAPERWPEDSPLWIVEGEPDAITACQYGLAATGLPGASTWKKAWSDRFRGRDVVIVLDCDEAGRSAATRVHDALKDLAHTIKVIDLDPSRSDGWDLTDYFQAGGTRAQLEEWAAGPQLRLVA